MCPNQPHPEVNVRSVEKPVQEPTLIIIASFDWKREGFAAGSRTFEDD
jgi:hypothetical protein